MEFACLAAWVVGLAAPEILFLTRAAHISQDHDDDDDGLCVRWTNFSIAVVAAAAAEEAAGAVAGIARGKHS